MALDRTIVESIARDTGLTPDQVGQVITAYLDATEEPETPDPTANAQKQVAASAVAKATGLSLGFVRAGMKGR